MQVSARVGRPTACALQSDRARSASSIRAAPETWIRQRFLTFGSRDDLEVGGGEVPLDCGRYLLNEVVEWELCDRWHLDDVARDRESEKLRPGEGQPSGLVAVGLGGP